MSLTFTDSSDDPIDLNGADDIQFFVNGTEVASLGDGITVSGTGNNVVTIAKADARAAGKYTYEIKVTDGDGVVRTYIEGKMHIV